MKFNRFCVLHNVSGVFLAKELFWLVKGSEHYYSDKSKRLSLVNGDSEANICHVADEVLAVSSELNFSKYVNGNFDICFNNISPYSAPDPFFEFYDDVASIFFSIVEGARKEFQTCIFAQGNRLVTTLRNDYRGLLKYGDLLVLSRLNYGDQNLADIFTLYIYNLATGKMVVELQYDHFVPPRENKPLGLNGFGLYVHSTDAYFVITLRDLCGIVCFDWKGNIRWHYPDATLFVEKYQSTIWYIAAYSNTLHGIDPDSGSRVSFDLLPHLEPYGLVAVSNSSKLTEDGWFLFPATKFADRSTMKFHSLWAIKLDTFEVLKLIELDTVSKSVLVNSIDYGHGLLSVSYFDFGGGKGTDYTCLYYRTDKPLEGFGAMFIEKYRTPEPWQAAGIEVTLDMDE